MFNADLPRHEPRWKTHVVALVVLLSLSHTGTLHAAEGGRPARPNILFILVDDYGIKDVGIEGSTFYETPNIDALARGGMRFTQGYAACQVCSPSRASILLGKYPPRHGITDYIGAGVGEGLRQAAPHANCGARLRPQPACRGHHAGRGAEAGGLCDVLRRQVAPGQQGFLAGGPRLRHQQGRLGRGQPDGRLLCPVAETRTCPAAHGANRSTLRLANETISFIEQHQDKPFLAYLSFYAVHGPIQTTRPLWSKYRDKASRLPAAGGAIQDRPHAAGPPGAGQPHLRRLDRRTWTPPWAGC